MVVDPAQEADDLTAELAGSRRLARPRRRPALRDRSRGAHRPDPHRHPPSGLQPPTDATPGEDRPWLAGMERLDDPRLARRFVTSRLLYRRLRRYLWAPPLVLAGLALLLRLEFVVDGLGHVFRSPRQQRALQHAYDASWFSRVLVTIIIGVALLAVLAVVVALTSRGIWRALGGEGLPSPWSSGGAGTAGHPARRRTRCSPSTARTSWTPPARPSRAAPPA